MNLLLISLYRRQSLRRQRFFYDLQNPLELKSDEEIRRLYRFNRENLNTIICSLEGHIKTESRIHHGSALNKICATLQFLATGNFQTTTAAIYSLHRSSISRYYFEVVCVLCSQFNSVIQTNFSHTKQAFYLSSQMPNIIGCIDCTHVRIVKPSTYGEEYFKRKNFTSINCKAVCDANYKFWNISASWPGSVHDSRIFKNSALYQQFISGELNDYILLGDSGYALSPFLLTPINNPQTAAEARYNKHHTKPRVKIEQTFGQLKKRFYCLSKTLLIPVHRVPKVILVCCILHNWAKVLNDPDFVDSAFDIEDDFPQYVLNDNSNELRNLGNIVRSNYVMMFQSE